VSIGIAGLVDDVGLMHGQEVAAMSQGEYVVGLVSCAGEGEARSIARHLVEDGIVACVHIMSGISAIYRWAGSVEEDVQTLIVVKTLRSAWSQLVEQVVSMHSDEVPEIIALPIVEGLPSYLAWIDEVVDVAESKP